MMHGVHQVAEITAAACPQKSLLSENLTWLAWHVIAKWDLGNTQSGMVESEHAEDVVIHYQTRQGLNFW
jgi:hypothetical protein